MTPNTTTTEARLNTSIPILSQADFLFVAKLAQSEAGLHIPVEKITMVSSRLKKRASRLGIQELSQYCNILRAPENDEERQQVISALTTNVTSFLRESHHFDYLAKTLVPRMKSISKSGQRIRIWSAGCSSGQEPYTIAMTLRDEWPDIDSFDVKILATDIDHPVLTTARAGLYDDEVVEHTKNDWKQKYFRLAPNEKNHCLRYVIRDEVKKMISFRHLNLIKDWPFAGQFDIIFCRNVVIYFQAETQRLLWPRFANACKEGGTIFVGHSERIEPIETTPFRSVAHTTYQKQSLEEQSKNKESF